MEHPNYTKQKSEVRARMMNRAHLEAIGEKLRVDMQALLKAAGFEMDIDTWGSGRIVLRNFPNTEHNTFRYDLEIDFETGEIT